jgi:hypothetical protein
MFAPNMGTDYPWTGYGGYHIEPSDPDFSTADTNHDGVLDKTDDPYTPYYPGDE